MFSSSGSQNCNSRLVTHLISSSFAIGCSVVGIATPGQTTESALGFMGDLDVSLSTAKSIEAIPLNPSNPPDTFAFGHQQLPAEGIQSLTWVGSDADGYRLLTATGMDGTLEWSVPVASIDNGEHWQGNSRALVTQSPD